METDTFPRRDVQDWLSGLVCLKINAGGERGHPLATKFSVSAFPTLVLIDPTGKILHAEAGAPVPEGFVDYFASAEYNAGVAAYNKQDYVGAAPHFFFVRKWFAGTKLGKVVEDLCQTLERDEAFKSAYTEAQKKYDDALTKARKAEEARLEAAREAERKAEERRAKAKDLKAEADRLYEKYLRTKAYEIYRKILAEYADLPEAAEAEAILKKNKQKLR